MASSRKPILCQAHAVSMQLTLASASSPRSFCQGSLSSFFDLAYPNGLDLPGQPSSGRSFPELLAANAFIAHSFSPSCTRLEVSSLPYLRPFPHAGVHDGGVVNGLLPGTATSLPSRACTRPTGTSYWSTSICPTGSLEDHLFTASGESSKQLNKPAMFLDWAAAAQDRARDCEGVSVPARGEELGWR